MGGRSAGQGEARAHMQLGQPCKFNRGHQSKHGLLEPPAAGSGPAAQALAWGSRILANVYQWLSSGGGISDL